MGTRSPPQPNASSYDETTGQSYDEVYGNVLEQEAFQMLTEGTMLPEGFRDIKVWRDLADCIDEVYGATVGSLIRDLYGLHDVTYVTESATISKETLLAKGKQLGITTDLNMFNSDDVKSFLRHAPEFWKEKGGRNFIEYMSFVVNAFIEMRYLWSENYEDFYSEGAIEIGTPVYSGGTWYPTSHVYIVYDVDKFRNSVNANFTSQEALTKFFYSIAPIQLVIKAFLLTQTTDMEDLKFVGSMQLRVWQNVPKNDYDAETSRRFLQEPKSATGVDFLDGNRSAFGSHPSTFGTALVDGVITGKRYMEFRVNSVSTAENTRSRIGVYNGTTITSTLGEAASPSWCIMASGSKRAAGTTTAGTTTAWANNDTIMVAVDAATGNVWFGRNGTWNGNPATGASPAFTGLSGSLRFAVSLCNGTTVRNVVTAHSPSSQNKYAPPSGFTAHTA